VSTEESEELVTGIQRVENEALDGNLLVLAKSTELETGTHSPERNSQHQARGLARMGLDVFQQNGLALLGLVIIVLLAGFAWIGPLLYHTNQTATNLAATNLPPSSLHPLGTDNSGFDVLGRLMAGGQVSLEVGLGAAALGAAFGVLWGATAGFVGGIVDAIMMRIVDALLAIPPLFLMLFLASIVTPSVVLLIFVIAFVSWLVPARLIRGETLSLRERDYVMAGRGMGASSKRLVLRHIIPNTLGTIVVNTTFQVADAILLLAYLSFLGLGIPAPAANWGEMLSNGINFIYSGYWWQIWPAGICIVLTVVSFNFVGDALRDALEVRLQER